MLPRLLQPSLLLFLVARSSSSASDVSAPTDEPRSPPVPPIASTAGPFAKCVGPHFHVAWDPAEFHLVVTPCSSGSGGGRRIWSSTKGKPFVAAGFGEFEMQEVGLGSFRPAKDDPGPRTDFQSVDMISADAISVTLGGALQFRASPGSAPANYTLKLSWDESLEHHLTFDIEIRERSEFAGGGHRASHAYLRYETEASEAFFGFGEQYSVWNVKGKRLPILTQEQGIGRGLQPLSFLADFVEKASAGEWHTSYSSIPHYVTSKNRSLYLRNYLYSIFDLTDDDAVEVAVIRNPQSIKPRTHPFLTISWGVVLGDSPKELVSRYTKYAGRMPALPSWAICGGAVLGLEGGTDEVLSVYRQMRDVGTPMAALWIQDWSGYVKDDFGTRVLWNWELNTDHYPGWDAMLDEIQQTATRVMTYVNPYLTDRVNDSSPMRNLFKEAAERGFLVRNSSGQPYVQRCGSRTFTFGTIDLANPEAAEWYATEVLGKNMLQNSNASGWMADFGEYLPFDSVIGGRDHESQVDPQYFHNRFPEEWTKLNSLALARQNRQDDVVFFSRAISTRSPKYGSLFWAGDQLVTWDRYDGLHSALLATLSGGISGIALTHSDIGGYTMIERCILFGYVCMFITRKCELLMRWAEMSAFTDAMFRTHLGSGPGPFEAQIYSSAASKTHFANFAQVHKALCEYRTELVREAADSGLPIARHPMLEFPDDQQLQTSDAQVMLGSEIMMAPVLSPGTSRIRVYLPALGDNETWVRWPGLDEYQPGGSEVDAPIGEPAVFFRSGFKERYPNAYAELREQASLVRETSRNGGFVCPKEVDYRMGVVELVKVLFGTVLVALLPYAYYAKVRSPH